MLDQSAECDQQHWSDEDLKCWETTVQYIMDKGCYPWHDPSFVSATHSKLGYMRLSAKLLAVAGICSIFIPFVSGVLPAHATLQTLSHVLAPFWGCALALIIVAGLVHLRAVRLASQKSPSGDGGAMTPGTSAGADKSPSGVFSPRPHAKSYDDELEADGSETSHVI